MMKKQAVRLANAMAGLRPQIVKWPYALTTDSFQVEYSEVAVTSSGELVEFRRVQRYP